MAEFTKPVIGSFCWVEANLEDPALGKGFYGELFGWKPEDMPMPEQGTYTMFKLGTRQAAGMLALPAAPKSRGVPSHWLNYVAVTNVASATQKAEGLGAKVLLKPKAVGPGTMSVIQDPTGGVLALWANEQSMGTFVYGEVNAMCWNEFFSPDAKRALEFYTRLFGWTSEAMPTAGGEYIVLKNGGDRVGGLMQRPANLANEPMSWMAYFAVADCDATAAKAARLGGTIVQPPTDIPNVGRFALLLDNQRAAFAIIKNLPRS